MKQLYCWVIIYLFPFFLNGQSVQYWDFEEEANISELKGGLSEIRFRQGVVGNGLLFYGGEQFVDLSGLVDVSKNFTISFWFQAENLLKHQSLFYQFRHASGAYEVDNFIKLEIKNGQFIFKSEEEHFPINVIPLKSFEWYNVAYVYDGNEVKLYLQGQLIYTKKKASFYAVTGKLNNHFFIGKSHLAASTFEGIIDELKISTDAKKLNEVEDLFRMHSNNIPTAKIPSVFYAEGELQTADLETDNVLFVDKYEMLPPVIVENPSVTFTCYLLDGDKDAKLSIIHNENIIEQVKLKKEGTNVNVLLNDNQSVGNSFLFEGFQIKKGGRCLVRIDVKAKEKTIASYEAWLNEKNVVLPVVKSLPDNDKLKNLKVVTVKDNKLEILVKDNAKVDGDVITILQEGSIILENYELTTDFKTVEVMLKQNSLNEFVFFPVEMGELEGENTALVILRSNGVVLHQFSLRSLEQSNPARLTIIHQK